MAFEIYSPGFGRHLSEMSDPLVSIQLAGTIALSGGAEQLTGIKPGGKVVLLFDRQLGQIALRTPITGDRVNQRLAVSQRTGRQALRVAAKGLFVTYGIDIQKAQGYWPLALDDRSGLYVVQLPAGSWKRPVEVTPIRERLNGRRAS